MDIFTYYFFQRALIGGILIGMTTPLIGMFIVLRRLSMIGETIAHVSIAGVALGFLINVYPLWMGIAFAVIAAFGIEKLRRTYRTYAELSIAIVLSAGVGLASIFFTTGRGYSMDVRSYMFGNILSLNDQDLWLVLCVTIVVVSVVYVFFKELFLISFDEDTAKVNGLPLHRLNFMITLMTALVVSAAIKIVGALLVSALLTIPVACSLVIGRGFRKTMWIAIIYSEIAVICGLTLAGIMDFAPGGTIVLLLIGLLVSTLAAKRLFRF